MANVYVSVSPAFAGLNKLCKPFESTGSAQKQIYQMSLNNEYLSARVCCKGLVRETAVGKAKDNNKQMQRNVGNNKNGTYKDKHKGRTHSQNT